MYRKKIIKISDDNDAAGLSTPANKPPSKAKAQQKKAAKKPAKAKTRSTEDQDDSGEEDSEADDEEQIEGIAEDEYSPATKAILEAMAGSDVTPDEDSNSDEEVIDDKKGKGKAA